MNIEVIVEDEAQWLQFVLSLKPDKYIVGTDYAVKDGVIYFKILLDK